MAYTRRPLNPLMPFVNQVVVESSKVNDNFEILANAFQGGNPATGVVLNAVNSQYSQNADKVDGFHASQTPAPNVIVPLNADGFLDLSATYIRSNVYTFRRVDLTNATSNYDLQVGEEAVVRFDNQVHVSFRVRVQEPSTPLNPVIYEIIGNVHSTSDPSLHWLGIFFNGVYMTGQINCLVHYGSNSGWNFYSERGGGLFVRYDCGGSEVSFPYLFKIFAVYHGAQQPKILYGWSFANSFSALFSAVWDNTTTAWVSLGGSDFKYSGRYTNASGIALVRRLA